MMIFRRFPMLTLAALLGPVAFTACGDSSEAGDAAAQARENNGQEPVAPAPVEPGSGAPEAVADDGDGDDPHPLGEPREDLERFYGVYGSSDSPGRDFFVAPARRPEGAREQIPPGYLMVGAMWGDVAPFYMKSLGELEFGQQWVNPHAEAVKVRFEPGDGAQAAALEFGTVFDARGRLDRIGDLPQDWE